MVDLAPHVRAVLAGKEPARDLSGELTDLTTAYDLADKTFEAVSPTCGWKIAANAPDQRANPDLGAPIFARIAGGAPVPTGSVLKLSDFTDFALEPEFAAVLGAPVSQPLDAPGAREKIAAIHVAFELLDRRGLGPVFHLPTFVALNVFNAGVVMGQEVPKAALADYSARFSMAAETQLSGRNTAPQDPFEAVADTLNHATSRGFSVPAGAVILCGTHHPPVSISAPTAVEFEVSGRVVSLSISD
ncbi:MAG: fumarylacetoacetate hydrolase family protein [Pseudomonadota bacterium]